MLGSPFNPDDPLAGPPDGVAEEAAFTLGAGDVQLEALSDDEREALQEALAQAQAEVAADRDSTLQAVATVLVGYRSEAVNGRMSSGIEDEWLEDEEFYEGIDDANREEEGAGRVRKPAAGGGMAREGGGRAVNRSTVFLNITRPYVDTGSARVCDMLLPTDDRAWMFAPPVIADMPGNVPQEQVVQPGQPPAEKTPIQQAIDKATEEAKRRTENAQRRVDDWLTECNWHAQVRMVIHDSSRMGTGVLKGPTPINRGRAKWNGDQLERWNEIAPTSRRIDPWDAFPDPACGESIHNGRYHFERDRLTMKQVGELREEDGYFIDQLELVLKEGPSKHTMEGRIDLPRDLNLEKAQYEVWYCYATLGRQDLLALGCDCPEDEEPLVPIMATLINDRVVKIVLNPLEKGDFPYDYLPWQERKGMPWGRGVGRQVRVPQRMLNGATRNMMDNAALSAGIILFLRTRGLSPADGNWNLHGRKIFRIDDPETSNNGGPVRAQDWVDSLEIPSRQAELMAIINFALQMAEDVTGLPMLLQGQNGRTAPQTLGGQELAINNANGVLRRLAKLFDDRVTEPHITRYYDWLQAYGTNPEEKCDAIVDARGSSALVERTIQNQAIAMMGAYVKDPAFGINPAKWWQEWAKSNRLDPERFKYTDAELEQIKSQPPPKPYQVQVAEINAQAKGASDAAAKERELIKLLGEENLSVQQIKARLAEVLTTDRRERDLFTAESALRMTTGQGI